MNFFVKTFIRNRNRKRKALRNTHLMTAVILLVLCSLAHAQSLPALPETPPIPKDNPMSKEKVELGKMLFFDPRLSSTGTVSCNSCHNVMAGGDDNRPMSVGIEGKLGTRSAPTVWNSAFYSVQFWDGRAASLEEQAKGPIINPVEMGFKLHEPATHRIAMLPDYEKRFKKVFGGENPVTIDNIVKAIAAYERTLITAHSDYDRFAKGDKKALTPAAQRGLKLVQTVGCTSCHMPPLFAGPPMPPGQGFYKKFPTYPGSEYDSKYKLMKDQGRYNVTKNDADRHMYKIPTWRNVAITAPYFHNGSVNSLDEAVRVMAKTQLNKTITDEEVKDIVAFLISLTGPFPEQKLPRLPALLGTTFDQ